MRRATGIVVSLWLVGWIPSIVYSWRVGGGPQFYAVWIILAPIGLGCAYAALVALVAFYAWAFGRPQSAIDVRLNLAKEDYAAGRLDLAEFQREVARSITQDARP